MFQSELIILLSAVVDLAFVFYLYYQFGKEGLVVGLVTNLFLISSLGAGLIRVFDYTTNVGNVFYASALFVFALMIERNIRGHYRMIWIGFFGVLLALIMSGLTVNLQSVVSSQTFNEAIQLVLVRIPRVAFASLSAYILAVHLFNFLYGYLKRRTKGAMLWARVLVAAAAAQIVDSIVFFTIAFAGLITSEVLVQTIWIGFALKMFIALLSIPLLYASKRVKVGGSEAVI